MKPFLFNHLEASTMDVEQKDMDFSYSASADVNVRSDTRIPLFEGLTEVDAQGVFRLKEAARLLVSESLHSTETRTFTEEEPPDEDDSEMLHLSIATETLTRSDGESGDPDTQFSDHILLSTILSTETGYKSNGDHDPADE